MGFAGGEGKLLMDEYEAKYVTLRSSREVVEGLVAVPRGRETGSDEGLGWRAGSGEYNETLWCFPSAPTTSVEAVYDLRTRKLTSSETTSYSGNGGQGGAGAGSGLNAALDLAVREEEGTTRHGRTNAVSTSRRTFASATSTSVGDTSRWVDDLKRAVAKADVQLFAQAPGLRRSVWCTDAAEVEDFEAVEAVLEAEKSAAAVGTDDEAGGDEARENAAVASFGDVFTNKNFSTALEDFLGANDEAEEDEGEYDDDAASSEASRRKQVAYNVQSDPTLLGDDSEFEKLMDHLDKHDDFWYQAKQAGKSKDKKRWAVSERIENLDEAYKKAVTDPAMTFPFELDGFQKEAIIHLERNESVFVAAHTSAGKTVVAEYAFALASKHCSRAVYTSPIKTISNQKFRDFTDNGFDVGLLTGDVSIKPEASSLIMTTEILRSMLYRGANMIRDIEWVIFDEVHYVNDIERGVVWEEVIIMLPETVSIVCLSATVPNVVEFADWIGRTKRQNIYITGTMKRPVPLEHSVYYKEELYKVCEGPSFNPAGYKKLSSAHKEATAPKPIGASSKSKTQQGGSNKQQNNSQHNQNKRGQQHPGPRSSSRRGPNSQHRPPQRSQQQRFSKGHSLNTERTQLGKLLAILKKEDLLPTIIFAFSKKRCDLLAEYIRSRDMTTAEEKGEIHNFCSRSFSRLTGTDRSLPQINRVQDLLKKGIGVHHSGLLPIVREVVEMLFCKGLVKILFSTETFAMGVNAPARAVVFHSLRKHDGQSFRTLLSGEYTQMAGRAGRRGLDDFGTVIIACWDGIPGELELKKLITGSATRLQSQFRLTYNMILNLLRVDEMKIEDMIRRSFGEFHAQAALPNTKALLKKASKACTSLDMVEWPVDNDSFKETEVHEYTACVNEASKIGRYIMGKVQESHSVSTVLSVGRPVLYYQNSAGDVPQIAIICDMKNAPQKFGALGKAKKKLVLFVLHNKSMPMDEVVGRLEETTQKLSELKVKGDASSDGVAMYSKRGGGKVYNTQVFGQHLPVTMESKGCVWSVREVSAGDILCVLRGDMGGFDGRAVLANDDETIGATVEFLAKVWETFLNGKEMLLSAKGDLKLQDIDDIQSYLKLSELIARVQNFRCNVSNKLFEQFRIVQAKMRVEQRVSELRHKLSDASLQQMPEFHQRIAVLQQFGYLDHMQLVQMKGRVACEIQSCDELLATEMIFRGVLTSLKPEEAISLISSLVFQGGRSDEEGEMDVDTSLRQKCEELTALALEIGEMQQVCQMLIPPEDYLRSCLNFGLVKVVYEWACGREFKEICDYTDVMEGTIVRTIIRLEETCREFKDAARVMGDPHLLKLMEEASFMIKRDVIFAASLYVQ
ncbi:ATP-dependent RNA helicase [Chloropicon primus]|nr:ATP-dependent RNA helicase [Chloropicon primus]